MAENGKNYQGQVKESLELEKLFASDRLLVREMAAPVHFQHDFVPEIDSNYVFQLEPLNQVLLYLTHPLHDCLYIAGPSGSGKTTFIHQIAARLNWGLEQITLSNKCESSDLIGHTTLKNGTLVYEYGPLVRAMLHGEILLLNEIDMMSAGDLSALNDVLEGKPLTITANNGEIITPHEQFRIIATANTKGSGDSSGFYSGAHLLNQAFLDRWRFLQLDYPSKEVELAVLEKSVPDLEKEVAEKLVRLAGELRKVEQGGAESKLSQLSSPFSTRVLVRIAALMSLCQGLSAQKAVEMAFSSRLPPVEHEYVKRLCNDIFGHSHVRAIRKVVKRKSEAEKSESSKAEREKSKEEGKTTNKSESCKATNAKTA